jgi:sigma-E factor negative regulatory protein RseA
MANNIEEQLSALVDGEIGDKELDTLLVYMRSDPALRERWGRYNLISDALHKNLPRRVDHDLHARVARALAEEPVVLAPQPHRRRLSPWAKQAAGIAVAASVTAMAILGFQTLHAPGAAPAATTVASAGQDVAAEPEWDPYLVNHNEHAVSAGMHGMLPYVRLVSHGESE